MQKIYSHSERSNLINQEWRVVVCYVQQDRMWSSLSSLWQVLYTCYGHSSWNYSSPRSKTSPLNHLTYHCPLSILVRQWLSHLHTFGTALTWTLLLPLWKAFTSTRNQMYASDTSRNSFSILPSVSFDPRSFSFWANVNSSYDIILSYLVKNRIQRNMNRRGEKRVGAWREKSPSFTKITKEMNQ